MHIHSRVTRCLAVLAGATFIAATSACSTVVTEDDESAASASGLPDEIAQRGKMVIATGASTVPTHFLRDGKLVGFNVDIADELSERLDVEVELEQVPFDSVLAGIASKRFDTSLYNFSDSADRREVVDFVDYAASGSVVVVRKGEAGDIGPDPQTLCGHSVAVTAGGYEYQALSEYNPKCEAAGRAPIALQTFDSDSTQRQALLSGRADALVDGLTATPYMVAHNSEKFELLGKLPIAGDPLGMPVAKGQEDLVNVLKATWEDMLADGTYEEIAARWDEEALIPTEITVNDGNGLGES